MQTVSVSEPSSSLDCVLIPDMTMTAIVGSSTADPTTNGLQANTSYIQLAETGFSDTVLKALDRLREKSVLTDAIICVEDQELHCHKVVLSSCSDVFCQMFSTSTNDTTQRIHTSIVSADTMRQLVNFVYKGKVEVQRSDVKKLEVASKLYGVCSLSQLCERSLETVKQEPVLDCVGSDDVELEAGGQQNAEMSVLDSGTPADIVERVRVKEEDNSREVGETIYTNDGNGYEAMDLKSNRHGNRAINSFSTQCQSACDDGNQGHCQLDKGERSDASGAKQCPEKTITVKTEPFSPDDPEYWHSSRYQDGDADFNTMRNKQSSADTSEDLQDGSDNDDQQFYIATEVSDVAMATDGSFQGVRGGSTELSSVATERLATIHGGNGDSDNAWQLQHGGHEEESQAASQCSNTSSYSRTPVKRSIYPIYNQAATWNVTSRACLTDAEPALGRDTDKSTEAMPEPLYEIDAESQFSREGDKDAMDHAESDMQCKCVQCMGSVQSVELMQCRALLKLPMGKDCGEFFRSLALFRLHERQHDMGVSRVICPSCLQTFPLFGNCGEHFWNAHNDGTTWQDDDPHLPAAESENYIQEYSEQQSENDVGHNMEPQPQFEILASENQSDSVVINTCSESLSSRNYGSEVSRSKHYTCKLCGELFNPFSLFCLHVKQRAQGVSTNTCPMCGQTFSSFCSLGRHFKNVHKNKITSVNVISIGNTSGNKPGDYSEQGPQSGSLSSQSIDGSVNGASTDDEDAATDDEGNGTIIKRSKYWCQKCDKNFFKVFTFKIHESQHEKGLSQLQCPLCGWDYAHIKGVLNHFKRQHKSKLEEWGGGK